MGNFFTTDIALGLSTIRSLSFKMEIVTVNMYIHTFIALPSSQTSATRQTSAVALVYKKSRKGIKCCVDGFSKQEINYRTQMKRGHNFYTYISAAQINPKTVTQKC